MRRLSIESPWFPKRFGRRVNLTGLTPTVRRVWGQKTAILYRLVKSQMNDLLIALFPIIWLVNLLFAHLFVIRSNLRIDALSLAKQRDLLTKICAEIGQQSPQIGRISPASAGHCAEN